MSFKLRNESNSNRKKNTKKKNKLLVFLFLLPTIIIFGVFMFYPIIRTLQLSFYSWNMVSPKKNFVGLSNYINMFINPATLKAVTNSLIYIFIMLAINFVIPYLIAYVMAKLITKGQGFYKSVIFFPSLISLAVGSIIFMWMFNPVAGPVKLILSKFGITSPMWLQSKGWVILVLSLIVAWKNFGYNLIILLGAIQEVPLELIEAAKLENASNWRIFWDIIRPLTSSRALYVFVMTIVFGLQHVFSPIHILTQGGPDQESTNLVYIIYQYGFRFFQTGRAAAVAIVTLILFVGLIMVQKRIERNVHYGN